MKPVRTAVLPVAGLGTRLLPATKALPKEMLTIVDRPIIDHVVREARSAGIERFVFVTGRGKGVIEDHFDRQYELEAMLALRGKHELLELLERQGLNPGEAVFTRQQEPRGLGHAIWCAREFIGDEPFAVLLPDVIVHSPGRGGLAQLVDAYRRFGGNHIAVEAVPPSETSKYGIVDVEPASVGAVSRIRGLVEKPAPKDAPSNLAVTGRYILQPEIMALLADQAPGAGGEIQLTDAMSALLRDQPIYALAFDGQSFDCGSRLGFLTANAALALSDEAIADDYTDELVTLLLQYRPDSLRRALSTLHGYPIGTAPRQLKRVA